MKTLTPLSLALCSLVLLPSCAKKKEDPKPAPQPVVQAPQFAAEYQTGCITDGTASHQDVVQTDARSRMIVGTRTYDGTGCDGAKLVSIVEVDSAYKIGAVKQDKIMELDVSEKWVRLTPTSQPTVDFWNQSGKCGINDWHLNDGRLIDKTTGCLGAGNTQNQRQTFTRVDLRDNSIQFGTNLDRNDDGTTIERRHTQVGGQTYLRTGTSQLLPPEDVTCPNLVGVWRCTQSLDGVFGNKDATVTQTTDAGVVNMIRMEISPNGSIQIYRPGAPEQVVSGGGIEIHQVDACGLGILSSKVTTFAQGDAPNRTQIDRSFSIDARSFLNIKTLTLKVVNNRPDRLDRSDTQCVKAQ